MPKLASYMSNASLLLHQIIDRARLDRRTARYVLDRSTKLDFPRAGQGQHRRFSFDEALRLANCTRLVMFGMMLELAEEAVLWSLKEVKKRGSTDARFAFDSSSNRPWKIRVISNRYVQIDRPARRDDPRSWAWNPDEYLDVEKNKLIDSNSMDFDERIYPYTEWNVTHLALMLMKND